MDITTHDKEDRAHHLQEIREDELAATRRVRNPEKVERRERVTFLVDRVTTRPLLKEAVQLVEDLAEPLIGDARDYLHARETFDLVMADAPDAPSGELGCVS